VSGPSPAIDERRFVRRALIVIALGALTFVLWKLRSVLLMLFGAVVVAAIVRALADPLNRFARIPNGIAVALSALFIFGVAGGSFWLMGSEITAQWHVLTERLPQSLGTLKAWIEDLGLGTQLSNWQSALSRGDGIMSTASTFVSSLANAGANLLIVIFGGIYIAAEPKFYRTGLVKLVPQGKRAMISEALLESERALRLWLKGQLIAMLVIGLMTGVGLWLIGVPSPLVLGIFAGLLEFVPFAGPIIAAVPGILIALTQSTDLALWAIGVYIFVQQSEAYLIQPLIQQYAVELPAMLLLFSLLAFGVLFGTIGIVLAAPLAVVTYVMVKRLYVIQTLDTPTPIPGEKQT